MSNYLHISCWALIREVGFPLIFLSSSYLQKNLKEASDFLSMNRNYYS